jgi:carboxyl-terminal processing protease
MTGSKNRTVLLALALLAIGALAGGIFGGSPKDNGQPADDRLKSFAQMLAVLEDNYVGEIDSSELVENAIQGMLQGLDPHSNYLDRDTFAEMRDEQRGKFYGLGIQINKPGAEKPLTIIAPIENTPAHRAGLHAGDIIFAIEGEETSTLSLHQAVRRLKGDKGTEVTITVQRPSEGSTFDVTLKRDEVPTSSIRVAYMIEAGTGYIRIANFTSTTARELDESLRALESQGMRRLVLDLRSNPGGLLDQAVEVSKRFLPSGKLLVYTRGRVHGSDQDYIAAKDAERPDVDLVVLVDRHSASASEIVAGAVQDHDRGLLVGERTFGKGLVQRVIPLRNGGAVALTTAKYYTPSGRLIQRDFSDVDDYFLDRRMGDDPDDVEPLPPIEDEEPIENLEIFYTLGAGREVYGGGGITPDYRVPSARASILLSRLIRQNIIFDFAVQYAEDHPDLKEGFELEEDDVAGFRAFLDEREFEYSEEAFEENLEDIARQIRAQVSKVRWDENAESRVLAEGDDQIQKALTLFDEAASLAEISDESGGAKAELILPNPSL